MTLDGLKLKRTNILAVLLTMLFLSGLSGSLSGQISNEFIDSLTGAYSYKLSIDKDSSISLLSVIIEDPDLQLSDIRKFKAICKRAELRALRFETEEALSDIQLARDILSQGQIDQSYGIYLGHLNSRINLSMQNPNKAQKEAVKAIGLYRNEVIDSALLVKLYLLAGSEYGDYDTALAYQDTAYLLASLLKDKELQRSARLNMGSYNAMKGNYAKAKEYFTEALRISKEINDYAGISELYNNMAGVSDNIETIGIYIDSAIYFARRNRDLSGLQVSTENKAMYYRMKGDYKSAYVTIYDALLLKDTVLNQRRIMAVAEMQEKYDAEKKSNEIKDLKLENLQAETRFQKNRNRMLAGGFLLLSLAGFLGTRYFITNKHRNVLKQKNLELSIARERSDELLLNILPEEVAEELKNKGQADAKLYDLATIMFTDFIDFTKGVSRLSSEQLLDELNFYFRSFDEIIEKYQVEKIKTIGDSYMAVGGLPSPYEDSVKNSVLSALEMQEVVEARNRERTGLNLPSFEMRIGVHTGPIVAGIVGVKKFQYDVWGDAVNTASRLENTSEAGRVNISQTTYEHIKDLKKKGTDEPLFVFENRGRIKAKGKGELEMYFVELA